MSIPSDKNETNLPFFLPMSTSSNTEENSSSETKLQNVFATAMETTSSFSPDQSPRIRRTKSQIVRGSFEGGNPSVITPFSAQISKAKKNVNFESTATTLTESISASEYPIRLQESISASEYPSIQRHKEKSKTVHLTKGGSASEVSTYSEIKIPQKSFSANSIEATKFKVKSSWSFSLIKPKDKGEENKFETPVITKKEFEQRVIDEFKGSIHQALKNEKKIPDPTSIVNNILEKKSLELFNFPSRLQEAMKQKQEVQDPCFSILLSIKTARDLYNFYKEQQKEKKALINAILGHSDVLALLKKFNKIDMLKQKWKEKVQKLLNKEIESHTKQILSTFLPELSTKIPSPIKPIREHRMCCELEKIVRKDLKENHKSTHEQMALIMIQQSGLKILAIPERLEFLSNLLRDDYLSENINKFKQCKTPLGLIQVYSELTDQLKEFFVEIIGGKEIFKFLQEMSESPFIEKMCKNISKLIQMFQCFECIEGKIVNLGHDFDLNRKHPIFLADPIQLLFSFRTFFKNEKAGQTDFFYFNGITYPIPDLVELHKTLFKTEVTIEKIPQADKLFSTWLTHQIENTILEMNTTEHVVYSRWNKPFLPIPEKIKNFQQFLERSLESFSKEKGDDLSIQKNHILNELNSNGEKFQLDRELVEYFREALESEDLAVSFIFKALSSAKETISEKASAVLDLFWRYCFSKSYEKESKSLSIYKGFYVGFLAALDEKLFELFPRLYTLGTSNENIKMKFLNCPTSYSLKYYSETKNFEITHKKIYSICESTSGQEEPIVYGEIPILFTLHGNLLSTHYSASFVTETFQFNENISLEDRLRVSSEVSKLVNPS